ncbi:MAG: class I SAM-dependent methyltransferase [Phycisphaerae bacterium]|nr:class I SAM-dependent methyltransferase [Saprospiraceae bacterium]
MQEYTIHGGIAGKRRLEILSRTIRPGTERFLKTAKLHAGMRCLDLGCGGGDVTLAIAKRIGFDGIIVGLDLDEHKIQLATESASIKGIKNVQFKAFNAYDLTDESAYDLVYSRFLLSHLRKPKIVLQNMWTALRTDGMLLIEDTDFSGHFSHPPFGPFNRYVNLYQRLLKKRGADANIGQKLVGLLQETGFVDVQFQISQPVHLEGEGKLMAEITFEGISKALIEEGLTSVDEAQKIHTGLVNFRKRSDSLISLPRIFQVHGRRP